jgi:hypothetical protein
MKKLHLFLGLVAGMGSMAAIAGQYQFEFKSLNLEDTFAFQGGYGVTASLGLKRPADLKKEPKAISKDPLYGQVAAGTDKTGTLFRLDESKGTGRGYDTLILDLNQNGDLTDDAAASAVTAKATSQLASSSSQRQRFGPIPVPADRRIGGWPLVYYADYYIYNRDLATARRDSNIYLGYLRFKAGWYAETTAEFGGEKHKLAVYDANANFRLGDRTSPRFYNNNTNWYFSGGDAILIDANNSGVYEVGSLTNESCPVASVLYHGPTPYKAVLAEDFKSIRLDPYAGPLTAVSVGPRGDQVRTVNLGWEETADQWQLIKPGVAGGKMQVPPGRYRLVGCELFTTGANGTPVLASGYKRDLEPTLAFRADQKNTLLCGAPLEVKVTAAANLATTLATGTALKDRVTAWLRSNEENKSVRINALVNGRGGEIYSSYAMGVEGSSPPKPKFSIAAKGGKEVASGNLEFG